MTANECDMLKFPYKDFEIIYKDVQITRKRWQEYTQENKNRDG